MKIDIFLALHDQSHALASLTACQNHRKEKMKKKAWKENLARGCDCKTE